MCLTYSHAARQCQANENQYQLCCTACRLSWWLSVSVGLARLYAEVFEDTTFGSRRLVSYGKGKENVSYELYAIQ